MKTVIKALFILIFIAIAGAAILWGAGFLFVVFNKAIPFRTTGLLTWYEYWQLYGNDPVISKMLLKSLAVSAGLIVFIIVAAVIGARQQRSLHGDARFANASEIIQTGLTKGKKGIIVGRWKNQYLIYDGQQFVLMAARTRSGKGVGIVIPNLLNYSESIVVLDIKQENYNITAGYREKWDQEVYLFNPFADDYRTHRYNPLFYVREGHFRIADIQSIASVLYPGEGRDTFFDDQAANLFLGLALYLCETPRLPRTIGELLRQSSGKGAPVRDYIQGLIHSRNYIEQKEKDEKGREKITYILKTKSGEGELPLLSMECVDALNRFCNTSDNTMTSILASFNAPLGIWANPIVDAATSGNDFDLRDIRKKKITIYVGVKPRYLKESKRLLNLFFSQLIHLNTEELPTENDQLKYQCLLLLDEFTSLGRVAIMETAVSYIAGYNLRLLPIIQTTSQLLAIYDKFARNFISNFAMRILYTPGEEDAKEYSEMLGYETMKGKSRSRNRGEKTTVGETESDQRRALLLPQELKEMPKDKEIISLEHTKPIQCDKIMYYKEDAFQDRLLPAPKVPVLDLVTHKAKIEGRTRPLTVEDVKNGIDLNKLTANIASLGSAEEEGLSTEDEIENFVSNFFDALESADDREYSEHEDSETDSNSNEEKRSGQGTEYIDTDTGEIIKPPAMVIDLSVLESPVTVHIEGN